MEQVEYVTKTKVVSAVKITQDIIDGYETCDGNLLCLGDYLVFKDGSVILYDGKEFESKYRINSIDEWEDDIESDHGFEWALMQIKNGWRVRHKSWPVGQCAFYDAERGAIFEGRGTYKAVWDITHNTMLSGRS